MRPTYPAFRAVLTATLLVAGSHRLRAETRDDDIQALREQIRQLDQKLRALERKQELKDEAAVAAAKKLPVVSADAGGFKFASPDKAFELRFGGTVQFDDRLFLDDGAPNRSRFILRRIRTPIQGTVAGKYGFNITPELGGGTGSTNSTVALIDAWLSAQLTPQFNVKAGRFVSPVALEPGANRHFIESPFVNTLLPNRDIGIEFYGTVADGYASYRLGVYNGTRNNTQGFSSDEADGDPSFAGRIAVNPFKGQDGALSKLSLGLGFSVGNQRGDGAIGGANALQNIVTNGQQTLVSFRNGTTGNGVIADGREVRFSPSLEWYPGNPWSVVAEYASDNVHYTRYAGATAANSFTGTSTAWRGTVGYVLTGEASSRAGVNPASDFNLAQGTWGAFELVARVSGIEVAPELFRDPSRGGNLSRSTNATGAIAYGVGVNWFLNRNVRVLVNAEKTHFDFGGAGTGGVADDEFYLFTRLQLGF
jgi:phosphate-selective porin OprO/OprP